MVEKERGFRPHFVLSNTSKTEKYRSPVSGGGGGGSKLPPLDRGSHGQSLLNQLNTLKPIADRAKRVQIEAGLEDGLGLQVQFKSFPEIKLAIEKLAREQQGIELLSVKHEEPVTSATVFVPDGKLDHFEKLIQQYLQENAKASEKYPDGRPKNQDLVETIEEIRAATFEALWTDDDDALPESDEEVIWWECWLPVRDDRQKILAQFRFAAEKADFTLSQNELEFPERTIVLMQGSKRQITQSVLLLNSIAEIRRPKETAEFFDSLKPTEQREWVDDLLSRAQFTTGAVPYVCILDTGVNRGHPLLALALDSGDQHTIEPAWGTTDEQSHGTEMAGLALFGDLIEVLESSDMLPLIHRLESVKILRDNSDNAGKHYGNLTVEAIARPEITDPHRSRVFSMAITAKDSRDRGRPSAWSATIDRLACDYEGEGLTQRLIAISAGNVKDPHAWIDYPTSNESDSIHDPGQAWNAITVGAFTEKIEITETDADGYEPIAKSGALSPFSTTSRTWQKHWPLKPDVVFEGGNAAKDAYSAVGMHSLSLLTTNFEPNTRLFTTTNATSAATALCTRMAAQIMAEYPELWPETIRALIIHSAEWTDSMKEMFLTGTRSADYAKLVRHCGFGVPDLDRATRSASNSLTLVIQDELQPFEKLKGKSDITTCDMHLHDLPWPLDILESLGAADVEMRVTLSYFIEPNPGDRGINNRYRYESFGLRFDVRRPTESNDGFRRRVNRLARDEEEGSRGGSSSGDSNWDLGINLRHRGSIHSDIWRGSAVDLARRGMLAVYPALGWWKTRKGLERFDKKARYALLISIRAPEVDIDLYNAVENVVQNSALVAIES